MLVILKNSKMNRNYYIMLLVMISASMVQISYSKTSADKLNPIVFSINNPIDYNLSKMNTEENRSEFIKNFDSRKRIRIMFDSPLGYHRQILVGVDDLGPQ